MTRPFYSAGDYKAVCTDCGRVFLASELKRHWTGVKKCSDCWEMRHPQDFVSAPPAELPPPWTQPEPAPFFLETVVYEETVPPPSDNPPPNPGGGNEEPDPEDPPPDPEDDTPQQQELWSDEDGNVIQDENGQPIWE